MDDNYHADYTLHSLDGNSKVKHELSLGSNTYSCAAMVSGVNGENHSSHPVMNGDGGGGLKRKVSAMQTLLDQVDPTSEDEDEDDMMVRRGVNDEITDIDPTPRKSLPPNGKKTKGRVKIKMEFIDNKLRRYTTFSKRKTGIMKKAYELSTLTGTQVMLLVASETGHVYTFATRKLQPMITSEAGKALIQTCLNSPDPPVGPGGSGPDQRMSATGFEEVDLTYTVAEDTENKDGLTKCHTYYLGGSVSSPSESGQSSGARSPTPPPSAVSKGQNNHIISPTTTVVSLSNPLPLVTPLHFTTSSIPTSHSGNGSKNGSANLAPKGVSMHLPQTGGFTTILTSGAGLSPATALQLSRQSMTSTVVSSTGGSNVYRFSPSSLQVSLPGMGSQSTVSGGNTLNGTNQNPSTVTVVPAGSPQNLSVLSVMPSNTSAGVMPGGLMYQTAQGVVYAAPQSGTTTLPEGVILNLGQEHGGSSGQQFITFPVSLTHTQKPAVTTTGTSGNHNKKAKHHK